MKLLNNPDLFLKGTCEVTVKRPSDGQTVFQSSYVSTNSFTTEVDMAPIKAGLGNATAIQIPINAGVNLELTTADFSLQTRAMQVGGSPVYNAIVPVCVSIDADLATQAPQFHIDPDTMELVMDYPSNFSADSFSLDGPYLYVNDAGGFQQSDFAINDQMQLILTASTFGLAIHDAEPVACYGDSEAYCYVNYAGSSEFGEAHTIDDTGVINDFIAMVGQSYNVMFYEKQASAQELGITSMFAPGIYTVTASMAVFSTTGTKNKKQGTQVGWAYYYIPRMQFLGNAGIEGGQTDNAPSSLNGTALSYMEANRMGNCPNCTFPMLAYMTYVPLQFNSDSAITNLIIVGGSINLAEGEMKVVPVKYLMADNSLVQPKYADLEFNVANEDVAVYEDGVIIGVAEGETTMTITGKEGINIQPFTVDVYVE